MRAHEPVHAAAAVPPPSLFFLRRAARITVRGSAMKERLLCVEQNLDGSFISIA